MGYKKRIKRKIKEKKDGNSNRSRENENELDSSDQEILDLGLPLEFMSTKGKQVNEKNVEVARIGQVRKYQRFLKKKIAYWQVVRMKKARAKEEKDQ